MRQGEKGFNYVFRRMASIEQVLRCISLHFYSKNNALVSMVDVHYGLHKIDQLGNFSQCS